MIQKIGEQDTCSTPKIQIQITLSASTFIKLDFLFSSLFIAIFPARNCKISWQISWHFLYLYLAFRSFPTISFTVTIHSLQKYDLKLKISANSVFMAISKTRNTGTTEHRNTEHRNSIIPEHGTPEH
jgi:hypothetical protein